MDIPGKGLGRLGEEAIGGWEVMMGEQKRGHRKREVGNPPYDWAHDTASLKNVLKSFGEKNGGGTSQAMGHGIPRRKTHIQGPVH